MRTCRVSCCLLFVLVVPGNLPVGSAVSTDFGCHGRLCIDDVMGNYLSLADIAQWEVTVRVVMKVCIVGLTSLVRGPWLAGSYVAYDFVNVSVSGILGILALPQSYSEEVAFWRDAH